MSRGSTASSDHADFVAARSGDLVRLAFAIRGEREGAERAAVDALTRLRSGWQDVLDNGSPHVEARAAVVREALRVPHRRRAAAGAASFVAVGPHDTELGSTEDDAVDRAVLVAYAALPPTDRAAVALRIMTGLDWSEIGHVLGRGPGSTDRAAHTALLGIDDARRAATEGAGRPVPTRPVGDHLRAVLEGAADRALLPTDLTAGVGTARRALTRRRVLVGAGVLAVAAGGAAVALRPGPSADDGAGSRTGATGSPAAPPTAPTGSRPGEGISWPTRGGLGGDSRVRSAAATAISGIDAPGPAGSSFRVLYADVVEGRLVAVVTMADVAELGLGPAVLPLVAPDARPDGLRAGPYGWMPYDGAPLGFTVVGADGRFSVLVVDAPDEPSFRWSGVVSYDRAGQARRSDWHDRPLTGGVAVARVDRGAPFATLVQVGGRPAAAFPLDGHPDVDGIDLPDPALAAGSHSLPALERALCRWASIRATMVTGLTVTPARTVVAMRSPTLTSDGTGITDGPTRIVVLLTTLAAGAVLRSVVLHRLGPGTGPLAYPVETLVPIPAEEAGRRPVVVTGDPAGPSHVLAPGAAGVTITPTGARPASGRVRGGYAAVRLSDGNVWDGIVVTTDARGRRTGSWPIHPPGAENPLAF